MISSERRKIVILSPLLVMLMMTTLDVVESNIHNNNNSNNYRPHPHYLSSSSIRRMNPRQQEQRNLNNNDDDWARKGLALRSRGGGGSVKPVKKKPVFGDLDALEHVREWNLGNTNSYKSNQRKKRRQSPKNNRKRRRKIRRTPSAAHKNNFTNLPNLPPPLEEPEFPSTVLVSYNNNSPEGSPIGSRPRMNRPMSASPSTTVMTTTATDDNASNLLVDSKGQKRTLSSRTSSSAPPATATDQESSSLRNVTPVVYRYFGRSRAKRSAESSSNIPFIILGPSVDHWKDTGKLLASRGFNVMACQRMTNTDVEDSTGDELVLSILEALRWNRAILVGCDADSILAIQAAQRLAPERIAGLVLCGDLQPSSKELSALSTTASAHTNHNLNMLDVKSPVWLDAQLEDTIGCPKTIVSDGHHFPTNNALEQRYLQQRTVIVGGGNTPFLRLPEQFAWTLSRFVEEQVNTNNDHIYSTLQVDNEEDSMVLREEQDDDEDHVLDHHLSQFLPSTVNDEEQDLERRSFVVNLRKQWKAFQHMLPLSIREPLEQMFSSGSLLVSGRVVASAIIYISFAKVALYQYHGMRNIHYSYLRLSVWRQQIQRIVKHRRNLFILFTHRKIQSSSNTEIPDDDNTINNYVEEENIHESMDTPTIFEEQVDADNQGQSLSSLDEPEKETGVSEPNNDEIEEEEKKEEIQQKSSSETQNYRHFSFQDIVIS